jgi:hypothetical protein
VVGDSPNYRKPVARRQLKKRRAITEREGS